MASSLLDVGGWDDLSWEMEPLAEVVETSWGQGVVVVLPAEAGVQVSLRGERLGGLDDIEVLGVDVSVLWKVVVLLSDEHSLCKVRQYFRSFVEISSFVVDSHTAEDVLVNELAVSLWNKPVTAISSYFQFYDQN